MKSLINVWKYSTFKGTRSRAAIVFVIGFWMLDLANNTVQVSFWRFTTISSGVDDSSRCYTIIILCWQGPARALLADLSGKYSVRWKNYSFKLVDTVLLSLRFIEISWGLCCRSWSKKYCKRCVLLLDGCWKHTWVFCWSQWRLAQVGYLLHIWSAMVIYMCVLM